MGILAWDGRFILLALRRISGLYRASYLQRMAVKMERHGLRWIKQPRNDMDKYEHFGRLHAHLVGLLMRTTQEGFSANIHVCTL